MGLFTIGLIAFCIAVVSTVGSLTVVDKGQASMQKHMDGHWDALFKEEQNISQNLNN